MKTNDKKRLTSENGRPIADNQNTQTTDVEGEVNGLMTYDRKVIKIEERQKPPDFRLTAFFI